jgi:hypothetical protein
MGIQVVGLSLLIILWWVGIWGCIETLVHGFAKNPAQAFCVYFSLAAFALAIFASNPGMFNKLVV